MKHRVGVFCYDEEKDRWSMEFMFGDDLVYFDDDDSMPFMAIWCAYERFELELLALEEE